ncbi:MAG: Coq4 family protein [Synechococcales bacterium]|nr:Coq4 family protein [Synechococcales bacterium]
MQFTQFFSVDQYFDATTQQQNHFQVLLIFKNFLAMLAGDSSLETVGELTEGLLEMPAYDLAAQHLKRDAACAALIGDRYIPPAYDLDKLLTYPQNSLGYQFAATMRNKGFDPNLHKDMTAETDARYVELRLSQTHDIWHVVTGFDTSVIGEIGLQALHLPQFPYPLGTMLLANSLMSSTLLTPEYLPLLLEAIAQGFQMGKAAKPLFAQKWEEGWRKPLTQWRQELNVVPVSAP